MPSNYLPRDDAGKMKWLNNFAAKLPLYKDVLKLDPDMVKQVTEDAKNFNYFIGGLNAIRDYKKQATAYKNLVRDGDPENKHLQEPVPPPAVPTPPFPVMPNIFGRAGRLVGNIKSNEAYNEAIGKDLGIIAEATVINKLEMQPVLRHEINAGRPLLKWKKAGMQGVHIYVDRNDGKGNNYLTTSTKSRFTDDFPLPLLGQSAVWRYSAIYIDSDVEVGRMSAELKVPVSGIS